MYRTDIVACEVVALRQTFVFATRSQVAHYDGVFIPCNQQNKTVVINLFFSPLQVII